MMSSITAPRPRKSYLERAKAAMELVSSVMRVAATVTKTELRR